MELSPLAWLAGSWVGEGFGGLAEEHCQPARGGENELTVRVEVEEKGEVTTETLVYRHG